MKKLFWFSASLFSAFIIFCLIAFLLLYLSLPYSSGILEGNGSKAPDTDRLETVEKEAPPLRLSVIFRDSERTLMCDLEITPSLQSVWANAVEISPSVSAEDGIYTFISRCLETDRIKRTNYILTDNENFKEIADITGGIVYNDVLEGEKLLTGSQVVKILDLELFESACRQAAFGTFSGNRERLYEYITKNTVHKLSYPEIYSAYH